MNEKQKNSLISHVMSAQLEIPYDLTEVQEEEMADGIQSVARWCDYYVVNNLSIDRIVHNLELDRENALDFLSVKEKTFKYYDRGVVMAIDKALECLK